jgi:hypothetical protein
LPWIKTPLRTRLDRSHDETNETHEYWIVPNDAEFLLLLLDLGHCWVCYTQFILPFLLDLYNMITLFKTIMPLLLSLLLFLLLLYINTFLLIWLKRMLNCLSFLLLHEVVVVVVVAVAVAKIDSI